MDRRAESRLSARRFSRAVDVASGGYFHDSMLRYLSLFLENEMF